MVALYGTPTFPGLGILGEQDAAASVARVQGLAAEYQALTPDTVVGAFEIIVTIASAGPGEDGYYSNELPAETLIPWVEAARDAGVYVVLDLQPGRTDFLTQAKLYEPLLLYPNVGLAMDPEWRLGPDQVHLVQIGSVDVSEVNAVGDYLAVLTRTNHLPQKLLVLHQFMLRMIQGRENLNTTHEELAVLIHADGQGSQGGKNRTWQALHVGVDEHGQLLVGGIEVLPALDHPEHELVQDQQLLRKVVGPGQLGEVVPDRVDLAHVDRADLDQVHLVGPQAPLGVHCQTDVRVQQELSLIHILTLPTNR